MIWITICTEAQTMVMKMDFDHRRVLQPYIAGKLLCTEKYVKFCLSNVDIFSFILQPVSTLGLRRRLEIVEV